MPGESTSEPKGEALHEAVYGASFALYDRTALSEFIEPLRVRFRENGVSPRLEFEGRTCLDAGCGGGRGSIFMMESGAAHVTAVDFSTTNVETAATNLRQFGFSNFECMRSSLEDLPFPDGHFDFVWCNGVLMHTADPDSCLREISRVLKPGGRIWLYVYGAGGIYWHLIRRFRRLCARLSVDQLIATLRMANIATGNVAEYIDDWKTPFLRTYEAEAIQSEFGELGYADIVRLMKGMPYDTCARLDQRPEEHPAVGVGDLRFMATKGTTPGVIKAHLNVSNIEDRSDDLDASLAAKFESGLIDLETVFQRNPTIGILACARIQHHLRSEILSKPDRIDASALVRCISDTLSLARAI